MVLLYVNVAHATFSWTREELKSLGLFSLERRHMHLKFKVMKVMGKVNAELLFSQYNSTC